MKRKRRTRQIARLIYYYCCVRYMTRENGRWVKAMSDGAWMGGDMQYEYRFRIKMKWSYRRKVFHLRGIFAPNRGAAEMKLKDYVENYLDGGKIMDRYDYDILYCEVVT